MQGEKGKETKFSEDSRRPENDAATSYVNLGPSLEGVKVEASTASLLRDLFFFYPLDESWPSFASLFPKHQHHITLRIQSKTCQKRCRFHGRDGVRKRWANGTKGKIESCEADKYLAVLRKSRNSQKRKTRKDSLVQMLGHRSVWWLPAYSKIFTWHEMNGDEVWGERCDFWLWLIFGKH